MIEHKKGRINAGQTDFHEGQKVALHISGQTQLGFFADINGTHKGILYRNEVFQPLKIGQEIEGFIKKMRKDQKIDLCLQKPGYKAIHAVSRKIMEQLNQKGGFIAVTDHSRPNVIEGLFGVSKKSFKKAIGALYRRRLIALEQNGIRLLQPNHRNLTNGPREETAKIPARRNRRFKGFQDSRRKMIRNPNTIQKQSPKESQGRSPQPKRLVNKGMDDKEKFLDSLTSAAL